MDVNSDMNVDGKLVAKKIETEELVAQWVKIVDAKGNVVVRLSALGNGEIMLSTPEGKGLVTITPGADGGTITIFKSAGGAKVITADSE